MEKGRLTMNRHTIVLSYYQTIQRIICFKCTADLRHIGLLPLLHRVYRYIQLSLDEALLFVLQFS